MREGLTLPRSQWAWAGLALVQHIPGPSAFSSYGSHAVTLIFQMGEIEALGATNQLSEVTVIK